MRPWPLACGAGDAACGTGAAAGAMAPLGKEAAADSETEDEKRKARYRESDEVKTYYRVNRYPK